MLGHKAHRDGAAHLGTDLEGASGTASHIKISGNNFYPSSLTPLLAMGHSRRRVLATLGSVACAGYVGTVRSTATQTEINLLLNWNPSGLHAPYYAAKANGYYEDQGLTVANLESGQGSDFSAKQVALGNTDFAVTSSDQILKVNASALSVQSVGIVMQQSPIVVFTVQEHFGNEFTDVEQLAGKTVGTGPGMVRVLTKLLLAQHDVLADVELVDTGFDTVQQLLSGKIDAAGGVFGDAVDASHHGYSVDRVNAAETIPSYGHVLAASPALVNNDEETIRGFLRATARGAAWAHNNPAEAIDILVDAVPALSESRANQRDKWRLMSTEFMLSDAVRNHGWGWSNAEPWAVTAKALRDADLLGTQGTVEPAGVWTNDYLDLAYEYIGSYMDTIE